MLRLRLALFLTASLLLACEQGRRADASSEKAPGGRAAVLAPIGRAADGGEGDCPMDTTARHPEPVALVEEFVRRDAEGPFEREDLAGAWEAGALSCVERNTSDNHEVITAYRVEPLDRTSDSARVLVHRTRAFELTWDSAGSAPRLVPSPRDWIDTVLVVRTPFLWRIDRFHAGAHQLPQRALGVLRNLSPADSATLRRLVSRPGA